jgi:hypothetical protein
MRNIAFAIWMVGFSFNMSMDTYHMGSPLSTSEFISSLIALATWVGIGTLLYERKPKE